MCSAVVDFPESLLACEYDQVRRLRSFLDRLDQHDAGSQPDAWHRAEPVMRHVQHLSLESLVKMDHFHKEPPLNLKGPLEHKGGRKGPVPIVKEQIGNPAQTECPLRVIRGLAGQVSDRFTHT
jgi:hypothetical protein